MTKDRIEGHPTKYWHALDDGRVQCDVCPRACKMHEGQRGLCFVRGVADGEVVLTTYGRSSGFCVDPIEKKPLNHFLPGTPVLSFGTAGCNLTCKFCQNWDISKSREFDKLQEKATPEMIADTAVKTGCKSVAVTYNDPVIFMEYAIDTARACRQAGIGLRFITPCQDRHFQLHTLVALPGNCQVQLSQQVIRPGLCNRFFGIAAGGDCYHRLVFCLD